MGLCNFHGSSPKGSRVRERVEIYSLTLVVCATNVEVIRPWALPPFELAFGVVYPKVLYNYSEDWKTIPKAVTETENYNGCFDCNICKDPAREPVVTLCGHLYCWPCIYKWLHHQSVDSLAPDEHPQCPVCKDDISHTTMVPLYGRGHSPAYRDTFIPPRPTASGAQSLLATSSQSVQQLPYRNPYQSQHFNPSLYQDEDDTSQMLNRGATMAPGFPNLVVRMFGEMFCTRVFGNSENLYAYPNSYHMMGSNSPRLRRQEMQADKFLNRISIFLICCFLMCLIVF